MGKPAIKSTRLTVEYILNPPARGATMDEILEEYDGLTREDILVSLLFAIQSSENMTFRPSTMEPVYMCRPTPWATPAFGVAGAPTRAAGEIRKSEVTAPPPAVWSKHCREERKPTRKEDNPMNEIGVLKPIQLLLVLSLALSSPNPALVIPASTGPPPEDGHWHDGPGVGQPDPPTPPGTTPFNISAEGKDGLSDCDKANGNGLNAGDPLSANNGAYHFDLPLFFLGGPMNLPMNPNV